MSSAKILLVVDDQWIRNSLQLFLEEEGCSIVALESAEEGLDKIIKNNFDVVIADYCLPGMNGLRFIRRVKALQPNSVQILITAYRDKKVREEAKQIGVHDLIDKPISAETIESSLSHILSKNTRTQ